MKAYTLPRVLTASVLAASLALAGCGKNSTTAPAPGIQPQIANLPDDFSYQISSVTNFTGTNVYTWQNSGLAANVNQSTTVTAGTLMLQITDANGTEVYSHSLSDNGTFVSTNGVAGTWHVRLTYTGASGTVNFRAQKKT